MSIINRMRKQYAVLWMVQETQTASGGEKFDAPVQIDVRWEGTHELFVDSLGRQAVAKAKVYVPVDVAPGSYLRQGVLTGYEDSDPRLDPAASPVRALSSLPDLRAKQFLRSCML